MLPLTKSIHTIFLIMVIRVGCGIVHFNNPKMAVFGELLKRKEQNQ